MDWPRFALAALLAPLLAGATPPRARAAAEDPAEPARYLRLVDAPDGAWQSLEIGLRELAPAEGPGPSVWLVGAAHVASPAFFDELQTFLDAQDRVLFEGVAHGAAASAPEAEVPDDAWRARATEGRLRSLERRLAGWRAERGADPSALAELASPEAQTSSCPPLARLFEDGWGRPFVWEPAPSSEGAGEIASLGADGLPGGEGSDRDLSTGALAAFAARAPETADEGLQRKLANALGLVFQLDAIDSGGPHWQNCDMPLERLLERFEEEEVDASLLLGALDGSSVFARIQGKLLDLIGSSEVGSGVLRLAGIELLGRADELLEAAPGGLAELLDILLVERNEVVAQGVAELLRREPELESIAVFYGAGHLRDLEKRLCAELGYAPRSEAWLEAFRVVYADIGLPAAQVRFFRGMIRSQLEMQTALARAAWKRRADEARAAEGEPAPAGGERR